MKRLSFLGVFMLLLTGCGGENTVGRYERVVYSVHQATNAARNTFIQANQVAEDVIVETAKTREEGLTRLKELDVRREPVLKAFSVVYSALASAELLVELVKQGKKEPNELLISAMLVAKSANDVYQAVRAFK